MRVALVTGSTDSRRDGVAAYTERLAAELRQAGADARVHAVAAPHGPASVRRSAAAAARESDVVHVQFAPSLYRFRAAVGALPAMVGRRHPLVTTVHEYGAWRPRVSRVLPESGWRRLESRALLDRETLALVPRSRRVIATNRPHAAALDARFGGRVAAATIPIGANVSRAHRGDRAATRRDVRRELGLPDDAVLVAFFGFVHPVKGVRYLADAVARLATRHPLHLLVIGGFESMALPADEALAFERELRQQIADVGATTVTTITGFVDESEASRMLTASDLGALPFTAGVTAKSGSLLTLLAHDLPTVVTDGGEPELRDGENCVVAPAVRDPHALAAALSRLLDDPALSARAAAGGAALAAERSWSAIARAHLDLYAEVLA